MPGPWARRVGIRSRARQRSAGGPRRLRCIKSGAPGPSQAHPVPAERATAIGVDVGSTTAKVLVLGEAGILWARCVRHAGLPHARAEALLEQARALAPRAPVGATGT